MFLIRYLITLYEHMMKQLPAGCLIDGSYKSVERANNDNKYLNELKSGLL